MWVVWQPGQMDITPGELAVHPCRSLCSWVPTRRAPRELFACQGCGSQWQPGEAWTPVDADGRVPPAVRRAAERVTSGRRAGAAGSAGT
jgi:ribosomal protein L37AE/L43A